MEKWAKQCELCQRPARTHCEPDQANLCWACDAMVHGANFLVARHVRRLLCRSCQAPTPWRAHGAHLGPTVSVCERCFLRRKRGGRAPEGDELDCDGGEEEEEEEEDEDGDQDQDNEEEEKENLGKDEDADNQVVPWTSTPPPPPPAGSSSSSRGGESARIGRSGVVIFEADAGER